jgi:predicted RND superfamily exporter protein
VKLFRDGWLQLLVSVSVKRSIWALSAWIVIAACSSLGVTQLEVDTGTSSFLDRLDPGWNTYQDSLVAFGGDEVVVVGFESEISFDPVVLSKIKTYTEIFETVSGVRRVESIASVPVISAQSDGTLSLEPALVRDPLRFSDEVQLVRNRLSRDRIAPRNLVSDDGRFFAINVFLDEYVEDGRDQIVSTIRSLVDQENAWISGVPVFRTEVNAQTRGELAVYVPATVLLVGVIVFLFGRSVTWVAISLGSSGAATWVLMGVMGAAGVPLSLSTMILPSILLALGCAYTMHVLSAVEESESLGDLEREIARVAEPVGVSGLTTAIGFLAMSTVRIDAIREMGLYGAIGVLVVLLTTLSLVPALLSFVVGGRRRRFRSVRLRAFVERNLVPVVLDYRGTIVAVWLALLSAFTFGLFQLYVETDIVLWFSKDTDVRQAYEKIRSELSGITPISVIVSSEGGGSIATPERIEAIYRLANFLDRMPSVGKVVSVADPLIQIHSGIVESEAGLIPPSADLISQYLLLLSSVDQLQDVLSSDRAKARIQIRLDENGSRYIVGVGNDVARWWEAYGDSDLAVTTTGIMHEFGRAEEEIAHGQIRGFVLAFGAIGIVLSLIFRDPRIVLSALLPNVIPLVIAYGFMGLVGVPLDAATICLGSLALGIAVDDTIHVSMEYAARRSVGLGERDALTDALKRVSPPLIFSTCAISVGFGVLGASDFTLIQHLGLITSVMVIVCLLADLTLLPALLTWNGKFRS